MGKDIKLTIEQDSELIGSKLFHWNSSLRNDEKLELLEWYKSLPTNQQLNIMKLREESYDDGYEVGTNDEDL